MITLDTLIQSLTFTLKHSLWEVGLIYAGLVLVLRGLRTASAHRRCALAYMALMLMGLIFAGTFGWSLLSSNPDDSSAPRIAIRTDDTAGGDAGLSSSPGDVVAPARSAAVAPSDPSGQMVRWLSVGYLTGVVLMVGRTTLGLSGGKLLSRRSVPLADPEILMAIGRQAQRIGLAMTPAVALCTRITVPCVVGVIRPVLLVPVGFAETLTPSQLAWILGHELAHIRRYDHIALFIQRIVEAVLFFHPAVWAVARVIRLERECACDDLAVAHEGERQGFAHTLLRLAQLLGVGPAPSEAVLAVVRTPSEARVRIGRLFNESSSFRLHGFSLVGVMVVLLASTTAMALPAAQSSLDFIPWTNPTATMPLNGADAFPLHVAASMGDAAAVQRLLKSGANPRAIGRLERTALHTALGLPEVNLSRAPRNTSGVLDIVRLLAPSSANISDRSGINGLHAAARVGNAAATRIMLSYCNVAQADGIGSTPLHWAAWSGDVETVQVILEAGGSVTTRDRYGFLPLELVAYRTIEREVPKANRRAVGQLLVKSGSPVTVCAAAATGQQELLEELLNRDPDAVNQAESLTTEKSTPLIYSIYHRDWAIASCLLQHGADPAMADASGRTPLIASIAEPNCPILEMLLQAGLSVNAEDKFNSTPLGHAAAVRNAVGIARLARAGALPNYLSHRGESALLIACDSHLGNDQLPAVKALLTAGADPNLAGRGGVTPLHRCAENLSLQNDEVVKVLLAAGAKAGNRDDLGRTPLDIARSCTNQRVITCLESFGQ